MTVAAVSGSVRNGCNGYGNKVNTFLDPKFDEDSEYTLRIIIEGSYLLRFRALSFTARADTGVHNLAALRRAFACAGNVVLGPDHLLREQQNKFVVGQSPFSHTASH